MQNIPIPPSVSLNLERSEASLPIYASLPIISLSTQFSFTTSCFLEGRTIMLETIRFFYRSLFKTKKIKGIPADVKELFNSYTKGNETMTAAQLCEFLKEDRGETEATAKKIAEEIIEKNQKNFKIVPRDHLNLHDFLIYYLLGDRNQPLTLKWQENDMNAPLAHYFWYTGDASYLYVKWSEMTHSKNPQTSIHVDRAIKRALGMGVRVIQLDLWPSSDQEHVVVYHEGMPSSSASLIDCLLAIKNKAFSKTDFPLVIILVDHLDSHQTILRQKVVTKIKKTFGSSLCPPGKDLKSLQSLKRRYIISTRHPKEFVKKNTHQVQDIKTGDTTAIHNIPMVEGSTVSTNKHEKETAYRSIVTFHTDDLENGVDEVLDADNNKIMSVTENVLDEFRGTQATKILRFTENNLMAVFLYPRGTRTLDSNYNPFIGWNHGAQTVGSDIQFDEALIEEMAIENEEKHLKKYLENYTWIMQGMFRANGGRGYVKKPDILLGNGSFDPTEWCPVKKILKVKVYMGFGWHLEFDSDEFDQTSPPDFFVAIEIVGVSEDEATEKTLPAMDQWIPEWNQEFEFPLTVPELALLVIKVSEFDPDRTHDFGGQTCLPVWELRSGIRSVPLYDKKGKQYRVVRLLLRFQLD